ncbi:MAG: 3-deoxy-7-phosphoheptulonate synthase [Pseudomonadota bacterium]
MSNNVHNTNVAAQDILATPAALKEQLPLTDDLAAAVSTARQTVYDILDRRDHRLLVVVGPCSIHDTAAALDYAARLRKLAAELDDTLFIVMRAYFEKPRTTVGWKGLINDPHLDDSFCIEEGLAIARRLLNDIVSLGLPVATEALDPISPQYLQDLIAWSAIGARTTESQTHREMASGLSSAVGFKNGTDGGLTVAINALKSASRAHRFLGINSQGQVSVFTTRGNGYGHVVLRGGSAGPNYDSVHIRLCEEALEKAGMASNIMVDCSHANTNKDPSLQPLVADNVADQIAAGNRSLMGLMIESNIHGGSQALVEGGELAYGVSLTDGCIGWEDTERCLRSLRDKLVDALPARTGVSPPA